MWALSKKNHTANNIINSPIIHYVEEKQPLMTGQLQPQVDHSKGNSILAQNERECIHESTFCIAQKLKCAAKAIIILVLGLAIGLLGFGLYYVIVLHSNAAKSQSILGHRNDTILLLGGVSSFRTSKVTVSQCLNRGDDYHNVSIFLRNSKDTVLEPDSSFVEFPLHYQNTPSHKSGIQDYLYLLENSNFTYWMCLASTTSYDQGVTYFLFRGESNYRKYVNDPTCGEQCSLLSVPFVAEKNNRTNCKKIQYTVSQADYYFMVVRSPANISYSYNFTLRKIAYDTGNARRVCSISDSGSCEFALPGISNKYDILAYIQPQTLVEESITTHLCASGTISSSINTGAIAALVLGLTACGIIALCVLIKRFLIKRLRTASNT